MTLFKSDIEVILEMISAFESVRAIVLDYFIKDNICTFIVKRGFRKQKLKYTLDDCITEDEHHITQNYY